METMLSGIESWQLGCLVMLVLLVAAGLLSLVNDERVRRWPVRDVDARSPDRESGRKILETADLVESRMHGKLAGDNIRLLIPPAEAVKGMDFDVRTNLDWLEREGRDYGVEVIRERNSVRAMNREGKHGAGEGKR